MRRRACQFEKTLVGMKGNWRQDRKVVATFGIESPLQRTIVGFALQRLTVGVGLGKYLRQVDAFRSEAKRVIRVGLERGKVVIAVVPRHDRAVVHQKRQKKRKQIRAR